MIDFIPKETLEYLRAERIHWEQHLSHRIRHAMMEAQEAGNPLTAEQQTAIKAAINRAIADHATSANKI